MDNMGAFITLNGKEMKPNFTTYEAVVCIYRLSRNGDYIAVGNTIN